MHKGHIQSIVLQNNKPNTYVGFSTAHGTELLSMSCVTAHLYRFSFAIKDFLSSASLTGENLTSIKSFAFKGHPDTGQKIALSGFTNFDFSAVGVLEGTQKLGSCLSRPSAMLEIEEVEASSNSYQVN